jgi:hypothetical protein
MEQLSGVSIDISMIPREALSLAPSYKVNFIGDIPLLTFWQRPLRDINSVVKRSEDIVIASLALVLTAPLLVATAALIKLSSPGPILSSSLASASTIARYSSSSSVRCMSRSRTFSGKREPGRGTLGSRDR